MQVTIDGTQVEVAAGTTVLEAVRALGVATQRWPGPTHPQAHDERHPYLAFQHELCISCGRCVRACDEVQGAFALTATGRGFSANITAGLDSGFTDSSCVSCGACADTCPTDAITEIRLLDGNGVGRLPLRDEHRPRVKRRLPSEGTTER